MKTGNILSKYYSYSIIWANKIIANIKGYSIDKAYEISPVFASMVQAQLDDYQKQLDRLKHTAMVFGVFDECKSMFDNFYKTCKEDIIQLIVHPKAPDLRDVIVKNTQDEEASAYAKLWDDKMAYVMEQIGKISLEKTRWLPSTYANIFKEQHQIINDLMTYVGNWNQEVIDIYTQQSKIYTRIENLGTINTESDLIEYNRDLTENFGLEKKLFFKLDDVYAEMLPYVTAYHKNMELLDKIREDLLND
jgi:hypothetical protein